MVILPFVEKSWTRWKVQITKSANDTPSAPKNKSKSCKIHHGTVIETIESLLVRTPTVGPPSSSSSFRLAGCSSKYSSRTGLCVTDSGPRTTTRVEEDLSPVVPPRIKRRWRLFPMVSHIFCSEKEMYEPEPGQFL